jgi:hypothetical protein
MRADGERSAAAVAFQSIDSNYQAFRKNRLFFARID